jgi:hypothetical protein
MESIKTDSDGVKSAVQLLNSQLDLISKMHIERVCLAAINRYNTSVESANIVSLAYNMLDQVINGGFVIRISKLKEICESLLKEKSEGSANFNINQQPHGGQSVSQPAPNCLTATSPC